MVHILKENFLLGKVENTNSDCIDKNLMKSLAKFYASHAFGNNSEFENYLEQYFRENYSLLTSDKSKEFLTDFSKVYEDENSNDLKNGDLFKICKQFNVDPSSFANNFGSNLVVKDGLVYEEDGNSTNVIYCTDKAINDIIGDLYGSALYHNHLATENSLKANYFANLQSNFINYANQNGITLNESSNFPVNKSNRRFIKKKNKTSQNNIVDFKQESC